MPATPRRRFLKAAGAAIAAPALARAAFGQSPRTVLKLHHFGPAIITPHARFLLPWTKKIEQEAGGRLRIDIYPQMQLGGTPQQLFDQVRDGTVDIVWTLPGFTPERFPSIEAFELPFVASRRALVNALALQEFAAPHLAQEFGDVHPLCFWAQDGVTVHARKQIAKLDDIKGTKLRSPSRLGGEALAALGASPVAMPIPQIREALVQRAIEGCVLPWEILVASKAHELAKFHTDIPGATTLSTVTFVLAMNKAKYQSLPADLRAVIDANSGTALAKQAGQTWDAQATAAAETVKAKGDTIAALPADEAERWRAATAPVIEGWTKQMKAGGRDGAKLLEAARALIAKHDKA